MQNRFSLFLATLALVGVTRCESGTLAAQPNIVFLLADDLGWSDVSCYGSPFCETPNIDRLASRGVRFTTAYADASICSPTRASLMTGKHPVRTGITTYIPGLRTADGQWATPPNTLQLALKEHTLGEMFQELGYTTFYTGKWHLGGKGFLPPEQGFEHYVGDDQLGRHNKDIQVGQRMVDAFTDFLSGPAEANDKPFLAYLAFHEPHIPILEYPPYIDHFREKAAALGKSLDAIPIRDGLQRARQDDAAYGSEVAALDGFIGQVVDALEQRGLADNTIIVCFSDNGGLSMKTQPGPTSNAPLHLGKGWLYEGGIRVPLVISWPEKIKPAVSQQIVTSQDLLPTLVDLAGGSEQLADRLDGIDGRSVVAAIPTTDDQTPQELPEKAHFWHYPHHHGSTWGPGAAMRKGDWKLIQFDYYREIELYNLAEDISEKHNLAEELPQRVRSMLRELAEWQEDVGAKFAIPDNMMPEELVAWCIVPFDAAERGPEARAAMLSDLGIRHLAYDWREKHVPTWPAELAALKKHDIELTSFWCSASLNPTEDQATQRILKFLGENKVQTQLWVMLPDHELGKIANESARVARAARAIRSLADEAAKIGCSVGLYNHGGWIGQPSTLIAVMEELKDLDNVGVVYNFHHAHDDLDEFPFALHHLKPYLMCINLNGTTVGGPKIQPLGQGELDRQILSWIRQVQYSGPIGILDHRQDTDARVSLQANLDGLMRLHGFE